MAQRACREPPEGPAPTPRLGTRARNLKGDRPIQLLRERQGIPAKSHLTAVPLPRRSLPVFPVKRARGGLSRRSRTGLNGRETLPRARCFFSRPDSRIVGT